MHCRDASKQGLQEGLVTFRNALWVSVSAYALALTCLSNDFAPLAWVALFPIILPTDLRIMF